LSKVYKSAKGVLRAVRRLFEDKKAWCYGFMAADENGFDCRVKSAKACKFCALGAISRFAADRKVAKDAARLLATKGLGLEDGKGVRNHHIDRKIIDVNDEYDFSRCTHPGYHNIIRGLDRALAA
jgi:hypothetical protein